MADTFNDTQEHIEQDANADVLSDQLQAPVLSDQLQAPVTNATADISAYVEGITYTSEAKIDANIENIPASELLKDIHKYLEYSLDKKGVILDKIINEIDVHNLDQSDSSLFRLYKHGSDYQSIVADKLIQKGAYHHVYKNIIYTEVSSFELMQKAINNQSSVEITVVLNTIENFHFSREQELQIATDTINQDLGFHLFQSIAHLEKLESSDIKDLCLLGIENQNLDNKNISIGVSKILYKDAQRITNEDLLTISNTLVENKYFDLKMIMNSLKLSVDEHFNFIQKMITKGGTETVMNSYQHVKVSGVQKHELTKDIVAELAKQKKLFGIINRSTSRLNDILGEAYILERKEIIDTIIENTDNELENTIEQLGKNRFLGKLIDSESFL